MKPRSLSARLILWYTLSAFALVAVASGILYAVLASELAREDRQVAHDELNTIRLILKATGWPKAWPKLAKGPVVGREKDYRQLYARLIAPDGRVVFETSGMKRISGPAPDLRGIINSKAQISSATRERDGEPFESLIAPAIRGRPDGAIQIAMDIGDEERLIAFYRICLLIVLAIVFATTAALGYWLARSIVRPIERIGAVTERIGSSSLHERIAIEGLPEELRRVAATFNAMLDRLEGAFARVGQFSDDVAHELRSPVNNLRGQIEVAASRVRPPAEYEAMLGSCLEECDRISRIISSLLFLARLDGSDALAIRDTAIQAEIEAVRVFYEAAAGEAGMTIETQAPPDLHWRLDRTLFQQALGNLVSNAIAHGGPATLIRIAAEADAEALRMTVSDNGCGIPEDDRHRLFDRFYRADRARTGVEHAGLGLSMVKAIVERHGGQVTATCNPGVGLTIAMNFPRREDDPGYRQS